MFAGSKPVAAVRYPALVILLEKRITDRWRAGMAHQRLGTCTQSGILAYDVETYRSDRANIFPTLSFEDVVREPVVAQELPDVFDRIELGAFWRQ